MNPDERGGLQQSDNQKDETEAKYAAMFERRAKKGQCFNQPYLGCREFSCDFRLVDRKIQAPCPVPDSRDLGWTLFDMDFSNPKDPKPMFYRPVMECGKIVVPHPNSEEVRR